VDRVAIEQEGSDHVVRAHKQVDARDPYLAGHFPGLTIYPGVFVLETVCQAIQHSLGAAGARWELIEVESLRLHKPLFDGERLELTARVRRCGNQRLKVDARCECADGGLVASLRVVLRAENVDA
jgi:3-hydroxyacyl-[acyl-carrier-protein] dehydratase